MKNKKRDCLSSLIHGSHNHRERRSLMRENELRYVRARLRCGIAHVRKLAFDSELILSAPEDFLIPRADYVPSSAIAVAQEIARLRRMEKRLQMEIAQ